jgi:hypothetical protein
MSGTFSWNRWRQTAVGAAALGGLLMMAAPAAHADDEDSSRGQWTMSGHDASNSRHQSRTRINPKQLRN